jgi:signal transduction histidine kinase
MCAAGHASILANSRRTQILIASRNAASRRYLVRLLSGRWSISIASCNREALKSAALSPPGLVLYDLERGDDTMQLLRDLKADSRTRSLPVILLSRARKGHMAVRALEEGAVDYIRRPVSGRELAARINAQLAGGKPLSNANRARAAAEQSLRVSDTFMMQLSHELRNPLNAVIEWASLLQQGRVRTSVRGHAYELIASSARLQQRLLDDLRDEQRLARGILNLNRELLTGLGPSVKVVVDSCRPVSAGKDILLRTFVAANTGPVEVDTQRLQQALWNLLSNAIKFTPQGGSITVRCYATSTSVEIQVTDNGVGIPREAMSHIFKPFRRATELGDGLGLGLSIAKGIMRLHGGSISAASAGIGRGATFTLRIPLADALARSDTEVKRNPIASGNVHALRILLAEDHVETAQALQRLLSGRGHQVRHANSVTEALELVTERPPDMLICDLNLKDGTGVELLSRIRGSHSGTGQDRLPAIVMSGYLDADSKARTRAAGFNLHLEKPVDPELLLAAIQQVFADTRKHSPGIKPRTLHPSVGGSFVDRPAQRRRGYDSGTRG